VGAASLRRFTGHQKVKKQFASIRRWGFRAPTRANFVCVTMIVMRINHQIFLGTKNIQLLRNDSSSLDDLKSVENKSSDKENEETPLPKRPIWHFISLPQQLKQQDQVQ
jgi:hypothetical protein